MQEIKRRLYVNQKCRTIEVRARFEKSVPYDKDHAIWVQEIEDYKILKQKRYQ